MHSQAFARLLTAVLTITTVSVAVPHAIKHVQTENIVGSDAHRPLLVVQERGVETVEEVEVTQDHAEPDGFIGKDHIDVGNYIAEAESHPTPTTHADYAYSAVHTEVITPNAKSPCRKKPRYHLDMDILKSQRLSDEGAPLPDQANAGFMQGGESIDPEWRMLAAPIGDDCGEEETLSSSSATSTSSRVTHIWVDPALHTRKSSSKTSTCTYCNENQTQTTTATQTTTTTIASVSVSQYTQTTTRTRTQMASVSVTVAPSTKTKTTTKTHTASVSVSVTISPSTRTKTKTKTKTHTATAVSSLFYTISPSHSTHTKTTTSTETDTETATATAISSMFYTIPASHSTHTKTTTKTDTATATASVTVNTPHSSSSSHVQTYTQPSTSHEHSTTHWWPEHKTSSHHIDTHTSTSKPTTSHATHTSTNRHTITTSKVTTSHTTHTSSSHYTSTTSLSLSSSSEKQQTYTIPPPVHSTTKHAASSSSTPSGTTHTETPCTTLTTTLSTPAVTKTQTITTRVACYGKCPRPTHHKSHDDYPAAARETHIHDTTILELAATGHVQAQLLRRASGDIEDSALRDHPNEHEEQDQLLGFGEEVHHDNEPSKESTVPSNAATERVGSGTNNSFFALFIVLCFML